jgi:hypothetical protein
MLDANYPYPNISLGIGGRLGSDGYRSFIATGGTGQSRKIAVLCGAGSHSLIERLTRKLPSIAFFDPTNLRHSVTLGDA